jgi:hypothetical protein
VTVFVDAFRQDVSNHQPYNQPNYTLVAPDRRHWDIFTRLCRAVAAKGNLAPDAYFAALAIE